MTKVNDIDGGTSRGRSRAPIARQPRAQRFPPFLADAGRRAVLREAPGSWTPPRNETETGGRDLRTAESRSWIATSDTPPSKGATR
jgi:hypothetical protein